jgi:transposase
MNNVLAQDTEVVTKARRRSFTVDYKRGILRQAADCKKPGEIGALLRQEGLYSSHLTVWRRELEQRGLVGLAPKKRGPKVNPSTAEKIENHRLRRELTIVTARAERAEMLVEIQKKSGLAAGAGGAQARRRLLMGCHREGGAGGWARHRLRVPRPGIVDGDVL